MNEDRVFKRWVISLLLGIFSLLITVHSGRNTSKLFADLSVKLLEDGQAYLDSLEE